MEALKEKRLIGISDGSVKEGAGTHAWTITTGTDEEALKGKGPVDGEWSYNILILVGMIANLFKLTEGQIKT